MVESSGPSSPVPIDLSALLDRLYYRYPSFLFDTVAEHEPGNRLVAIKNVTVNEEFFQGHFPGNPVMPGVLIVEALAQVGGIILKAGDEHKDSSAYLLSLDRVKFRRPVAPGDQLLLQVDAVRIRSRSAHVKGRALVDGQVVAEAEIRYALLPADRSN